MHGTVSMVTHVGILKNSLTNLLKSCMFVPTYDGVKQNDPIFPSFLPFFSVNYL